MFPIPVIHKLAANRGLSFLVIGGHAVNVYCEPRATLDVDFLVSREEAAAWTQMLESEGFQCDQRSANFLQFTPPYGTAFRLDLMLVKAPTFDRMFSESRLVSMLGIECRIPSLEHVIALKLHVLSHGPPDRYDKDFGDVVNLARKSGLDPRGETLQRWFREFGSPDLYARLLQRLH